MKIIKVKQKDDILFLITKKSKSKTLKVGQEVEVNKIPFIIDDIVKGKLVLRVK